MSHLITSVDPGSPAEMAGLRAGDLLKTIGGTNVADFIDYQALTASERFTVGIRRNGAALEVPVRKEEYAPLGLNFEKPMMSGVRLCCNRCLFCFVDQLPENVRPTMRVKDDDWRMSLLMGNYVTLTNVSDRELSRIIERRISPLYISVHATDPALRARILGTPRAARLESQLRRLSDGGIEFHCQAVLCPGLNDGSALEETLQALTAYEGAQSLALVPVGLTNHREGLDPLRKYQRDEARAVLAIAEKWRERLLRQRGTRFVFPSDEFYLTAQLPLPPDEAYEDYAQIDDGVGMLRLLETEFTDAYFELPSAYRQPTGGTRIGICCGVSAAPFLTKLLSEHPVAGLDISVHAAENRFFGPDVTVSGLVTAGDLIRTMQGVDCVAVLITECMLRSEGDRFLDDVPLEDAIQTLNRPIIPVGRRGDELLEALLRLRADQ